MKNQFEFKPFDKVLVRMDYRLHNCMKREPRTWYAASFSHIEIIENGHKTYCANTILWDECIPYNEETAHLVGTNQPYQTHSSEKKIHVWNNNFDEWMTEKEFKNFINTAVIHNKDICDFHVLYVR